MSHNKLYHSDRYFDHEADIGIIGRGSTICDAFTDAAKSLFGIETNISKIAPIRRVEFIFEELDVELAFVTYLNHLINYARQAHLIFNHFQLENKKNHIWHAIAYGDCLDENSERGVEVKGATLTMLSVKKQGDQWEARCVVDV